MPRVRPRRTLESLRSLLVVLVALTGLIAVSTAAAPPGRAASVLLSQGKPTTASSTENAGTPATSATDGDAGTRWSSAFGDPQWLQVDLGSRQAFDHVQLVWESAFGKAYEIQVSDDAANWRSVYSTTSGDGGADDLDISATARYVRMSATQRGSAYGYSLYEFGVYRR